MNDSSKIWKWMVIILTILNIALIVSIWINKPHHGMGGPPPHHHGQGRPDGHERGPAGMLIRELGFSPEQIKQFEALKEEHHSSVEKLMENGHGLRDGFFELLKNDSVNQTLVTEKAAAISENQKNIEMITFDHFKKVRAICNPEQKKRFDIIIEKVLRHMGPPRGGPGGPPPPHH